MGLPLKSGLSLPGTLDARVRIYRPALRRPRPTRQIRAAAGLRLRDVLNCLEQVQPGAVSLFRSRCHVWRVRLCSGHVSSTTRLSEWHAGPRGKYPAWLTVVTDQTKRQEEPISQPIVEAVTQM